MTRTFRTPREIARATIKAITKYLCFVAEVKIDRRSGSQKRWMKRVAEEARGSPTQIDSALFNVWQFEMLLDSDTTSCGLQCIILSRSRWLIESLYTLQTTLTHEIVTIFIIATTFLFNFQQFRIEFKMKSLYNFLSKIHEIKCFLVFTLSNLF